MDAAPALLSAPTFGLRDYLSILRRRKWIIITAAVVVTATALLNSLSQPKAYRTTTFMLLEGSTPLDPRTNKPAVDTEIQILESQTVAELVRKKIPDAPGIRGAQVLESGVITLSVEDTDPQRAAAAANEYASSYIEYRKSQQLQGLLANAEVVQRRIDNAQRQIDALAQRLTTGRADVRRRFGLPIIVTDSSSQQRQALAEAELQQLEEDIEPQIRQYQSQQFLLQQTLFEIQSGGALASGGARVLTVAGVPGTPFSPQPRHDGMIGLGAGLLLGVALALVFDYLDDSLRGKEDLERVLGPDIPVLVTIPSAPGWRDRNKPELVTLTAPHSAAAEAYRALRTSIHFLGIDGSIGSLQVTSPMPREGKTTTVANLAVVLAKAGRDVIVLDSDLRRPRVHHFFGLSNSVGLSSVILGDVDLRDAVRPVAAHERIRVLSAGPVRPNPADLLSSSLFVHVLESLVQSDALLLIDSPPSVPVADSAIVAPLVDATLLVTTADMSTGRQLRQAMERLTRVNAPLIGVVLNQTEPDEAQEIGYYGPDNSKRRTRVGRKKKSEVALEERGAAPVGNGSRSVNIRDVSR